jgi:hypothetical protein
MTEKQSPPSFDKRTAERYIRTGQLEEKDYERHLKNLPDVAEKASSVQTTMADVDDESPGDPRP